MLLLTTECLITACITTTSILPSFVAKHWPNIHLDDPTPHEFIPTQVYTSMRAAASGIVQARGIQGLYAGLSVTLLEIIPYAALQFGLYDVFNSAFTAARTRHAARHHHAAPQPTSWQQFVCGLAAGTLAKLATHPLDVVKKRFQVAGLQRSLRYGQRVDPSATVSLGRCVAAMFAQEGVAGFYKGVVPSLLKAAPAAAVTLCTYEFVVWYLMGHAHVFQQQHYKQG